MNSILSPIINILKTPELKRKVYFTAFIFLVFRFFAHVPVPAVNTERFRRVFHALLTQGIYIAPSPFESAFVSAAHTEQDITHTNEAWNAAISSLQIK